MRIVVTGAGGFIGQCLANKLIDHGGYTGLTLIDRVLPETVRPNVTCLTGDLRDAAILTAAFKDGVDVVYHLAALPGGAAEADYALSRKVNLEGTLNLFEAAARAGNCPRIVYASTIAVFGAPLPAHINDDTVPVPSLTYGAHKRMVEIALADLTRRGMVDALSLRLPGIVARQRGASGLRSAFMSDIFHAVKAGEVFVCPTSAQGTVWAMSQIRCADNLIHAAGVERERLLSARALTLPALRVSMGDLAAALCQYFERDPASVRFAPDPALEAQFAALPPLSTPAAERAGFTHDGRLSDLIRRAI